MFQLKINENKLEHDKTQTMETGFLQQHVMSRSKTMSLNLGSRDQYRDLGTYISKVIFVLAISLPAPLFPTPFAFKSDKLDGQIHRRNN
jgi:hypothetical protein